MIRNPAGTTLWRTAAVAGFAMLFGLSAQSQIAAEEGATKVLKFVPHADLRLYDPTYSTNVITIIHGYKVWDTLFAMDEDGQPQPQMVGDYSVSEDELTYTFTLREGLVFHDGEPVTARDAVASIRRWAQRDGMGRRLMARVESLEAVNENTIELRLGEPYGLVLDSLAKSSIHVPFVYPERLAETDPFEQFDSADMIGSGPYRFVQEEWAPGSRVVYERFEDYVPGDEPASFAAGGKVVNFDRVEWHYMPDQATAIAALQAGEVDYYEKPPVDLVAPLVDDPDIQVQILDPVGIVGTLRPNHLHPPFNDARARQALLWLTDVEENLYAGVGDPDYFEACYAFFMCGTPNETDVASEALRGFDPEKARQLLDEAGYDGEPIVILDATDISHVHAFALTLAQNLRQIGVNVEVRSSDWATVTTRRTIKDPPAEGGYHIFFSWWPGADMMNPITNYPIDSGGEATAWWGWAEDEEVERLRNAYAEATDRDEQREIIEKLQTRLYETVPYVPIGQFFDPAAYRGNLTGMIRSWAPFFWNVDRQE